MQIITCKLVSKDLPESDRYWVLGQNHLRLAGSVSVVLRQLLLLVCVFWRHVTFDLINLRGQHLHFLNALHYKRKFLLSLRHHGLIIRILRLLKAIRPVKTNLLIQLNKLVFGHLQLISRILEAIIKFV